MTGRDLLDMLRGPTAKAVLTLLFGAMAFAYSAIAYVGGDVGESGRHAAQLFSRDASVLRGEAASLRRAIASKANGPALSSVPAFIDRLGSLAAEHGAFVEGIAPVTGGSGAFRIGLSADYRSLIGFVAALEELDVTVLSFETRLTGSFRGAPALKARIDIQPQNDAQRLNVPRLAAVKAVLAANAARDPFQPIREDDGKAKAQIDLTASYKLTGVSTIMPSGERVATIDLFDYVVGDVIDGREIVVIEPASVLLTATRDGADERSIIRMHTPTRKTAPEK